MADPQRRLALVTGASAGLGEAFAHAYAKRGLDVALTARRKDRLEALADKLRADYGVSAYAIPADLAHWEAHAAILQAVAAEGRRVDVLVNNAGFGVPQTYLRAPWPRHREFLMTLVVNACGLAYGAAEQMVEAGGGSIINVASLAGFAPGAAGHTLYPAAKSFAIKFSQSLDAELRGKGVKVTALCPGFTKTEFNQAAGTEHLMAQAPRMFWQTAEQVVEAGLRANAKGRVVEVPAWWNKLAVLAMTTLPEPIVAAAVRRGAAKYQLQE
jgi:short-subunit dehydrogenase